MPTRVKICGITRCEDAQLAARLGAAALGFNFYLPSPRYIEPAAARAIIMKLPPLITAVGIFANESDDECVARVAREARVTAVQLHGPQFPPLAGALADFTRIRAVAVRDGFQPETLRDVECEAFLLDAFDADLLGGTGKSFNWALAREANRFGTIILAGGLMAENVGEAIREVRPFAVDVASGVESAPGVKDEAKLRQFFSAVREADDSERSGSTRSGPCSHVQLRGHTGKEETMPGFGIKELEQIVQLGGLELKREDRFINGCFTMNRVYHGHGTDLVPGIPYLKDERYYQRVMARALLPSFPYRVSLKHSRHGGSFDFALFSNDNANPVALGGMKLWMETGESELKGILRDKDNLANEPCGQFLIVLTISPLGATKQNVENLLNKIDCAGKQVSCYVFSTKFFPGKNDPITDGEFATIGILLREKEAVA